MSDKKEKPEKKVKKKGKAGKVVLIVLGSIVLLLLLYAVFCVFSPPLVYERFYQNAEKKVKIPDLLTGFIVQGVTAIEGSDEVLICGYMTGDDNSRVYRLSEGKDPVRIYLEREDGSVYSGHAGGLTAAGDYVYISNASKIFVLQKDLVLRAENGDTIRFFGHFEVPCRSSFCSSDKTMLYVGEYHADGYETDETHRVETADGTLQAMVFAYRLSDVGNFGIADTESPESAYAIPDFVQGFAVLPSNKAVLSCSHGLADSELKIYAPKETDKTFSCQGKDIPLTVLDSSCLRETVAMPHMSEDLDYRNGVLLIPFESGALKFGGGLLPFTVTNVMQYKSLK